MKQYLYNFTITKEYTDFETVEMARSAFDNDIANGQFEVSTDIEEPECDISQCPDEPCHCEYGLEVLRMRAEARFEGERGVMKQYFTFGQDHAHRVNGKTFDCDSVVEIKGEDKGDCRRKMLECFGDKWAFQYSQEEIEKCLHHFPRGIIKLEEEW